MIIAIVVGLVGISLVLRFVAKEPFQITTAECPMFGKEVVYEQVNLGDEWKCKPTFNDKDYDSDLLQPSGLWVNKNFSCWKLQTPIEEYCKTEPCSTNNIRD